MHIDRCATPRLPVWRRTRRPRVLGLVAALSMAATSVHPASTTPGIARADPMACSGAFQRSPSRHHATGSCSPGSVPWPS